MAGNALILTTYSFMDVKASIAGPGGILQLGEGAGVAEEGISIEMAEDKGTMVIGADGAGMHVLYAGHAGTMTVRLLKTSPVNGKLSTMYNLQKASGSLWGKNVITLSNAVTADNITGIGAAIKRLPNITMNKAGPMMEWAFPCIRIEGMLGQGDV